MAFGSEIAFTPELGRFERLYIKIFGAPILGLRIRARTILPLLDDIAEPQTVVDVGSGRGMITMACARKFPGSKIIGIDLDQQQNRINNQITEKFKIPNLSFQTFDAMNLPELGTFDLIISTDMLEHLEDDVGGVKMFYKSLTPGGHLLVHVPHLTRNTFGWKRQNWLDIEGHVRPGYTREGLTELLTAGGLHVEKCIYNYNSFETLANDISKVITGAREKNRVVYALAFPLLLFIAWLGSLYSSQKDGSGLVALAVRDKM